MLEEGLCYWGWTVGPVGFVYQGGLWCEGQTTDVLCSKAKRESSGQ